MTLYGSKSADVFDSKGFATTEVGGGGYDTYLFDRGYGALTIDNSAYDSYSPMGEIDMSASIFQQ